MTVPQVGDEELRSTFPPGTTDSERLLTEAEAHAEESVQIAFADLKGSENDQTLDRLRLVLPRVTILREFADLTVEGVQVCNLGGVLRLSCR